MIDWLRGSKLESVAVAFAFASVLLASLFIVRADTAYNQIYDEGAHIACGMEWLTLGTYTYETLHPPLARVATAMLPYLAGARTLGNHDMAVEGTALMNLHDRYVHNLELSRLGMLPFFWLACLFSFLFMRSDFGVWYATLTVVLLSFCPVVLTHSALATTDAPLMATFLAAVLTFSRYLAQPTRARLIVAAIALGLACVTKFSAMPFFLVSAAILIAHHAVRSRSVLKPFGQLLLVGLLSLPLMWAAYRFSFAPLFTPQNTYAKAQAKIDAASPRVRNFLTKTRVPAPEFFRGLYLTKQNGDGTLPREGYLLGQRYTGGRWAFFPVGLLVKTPIATLVLLSIGLVVCGLNYRKRWSDASAVLVAGMAGPLIVGITGHINIGLRHVLPIFPFVAMLGAVGAVWLASLAGKLRIPGRVAAGLLLVWTILSCSLAAPHFLTYFNGFASSDPGHFLVDSDLDWGQDYYLLESRLRGVPADQVSVEYFGDTTIVKHGSSQWHKLAPGDRPGGWIAVSETSFEEHPELYGWLNGRPYSWVGHSIRLFGPVAGKS